MTEALVLVGGAGSRLRERVADVPKPMALVGSRPFLSYLLDLLAEQGVRSVVLATGRLGHLVRAHYGDRHGSLELRYSHEDEPLGTGGAIRQALDLLGDEPVVVLNGDSIAPFDLEAMRRLQESTGAGLVLTLHREPDVDRYGAVLTEGERVVELAEKGRTGPGLINSGIYLVSEPCARVMRGLPPRFSFETEVLVPWVRDHPTPFVTSTGPFVDIGVPEAYDVAALVVDQVMANARSRGRPRQT